MHGIAFIETPEAILSRFGGNEADALGFFKKADNITPIAEAVE
jgi:hypothetical protein